MSFLSVSNVSKSFGGGQVLRDINIDIEQGEFLVLVGPSGCGKSTLLNIIAGLESATAGDIAIEGRVVNDVHPSKRNIAMVFQSYALYPNMSVAGNITFGLEMHKIPKPERERRLKEIADLLQIAPLLNRKPRQLSGGQRQRVAMGRALVRQPSVFLFDEPLSNLDAKLRVDMRAEIKKLYQKLGATMIYVTHDQVEALTLSTRIAVMNHGVIEQIGAPQDIYDAPANLFVATFIGSPAMNLIDATVVDSDGKLCAETTDAGGATLRLALASADKLRGHLGRRILLGVRPEALTDSRSTMAVGARIETVNNRVSLVEMTGADIFVTTSFGGRDCVARMPADLAPRPGDRVAFALNMDKAVVFDADTSERIA